MKNKAIFFDRDGIVNIKIENGYVTSINEFIFVTDFFSMFKWIKKQEYLAILVTNQQCIAKGLLAEAELIAIHNYMQDELMKQTGYKFDNIYYCGDLANTGSLFRKPEIGMFIEAINDFNIDVKKSWTIGDSISDVMAGKKVGSKTILVTNYEQLSNNKDIKTADYIFSNITEVGLFLKKS